MWIPVKKAGLLPGHWCLSTTDPWQCPFSEKEDTRSKEATHFLYQNFAGTASGVRFMLGSFVSFTDFKNVDLPASGPRQ